VRRWLNCLLIGVLTCSLSVDTARACWYLRHAHSHAVRRCWRPTCPPVTTWPACHGAVVSDSICGSGIACGSVAVVDGWRVDACCGGEPGSVVDSLIVHDGHSVVGEVVVGPAESVAAAESVDVPSGPTIAAEPAPAAVEPIVVPQNGVAAVAPAVPDLKPAVDTEPTVEPVVALEPAPVEPATVPAPEEPPAEPAVPESTSEPAREEPQPEPAAAVEPPAPPAEPNIFEEVESAADADAAVLPTDGSEAAVEPSEPSTEPGDDDEFGEPAAAPAPAPVTDPLAEPSAAEPAVEPAADASEPAPEPVTEPAAADAPAPAVDEPASQPAVEADPVSDAGREPLRRWVDDTGSYATVGMLVDVRADAVEIRKANGRTVIVPLERLSDHDREYAAAAEARLAADRAPPSRETAGL